MTLEHNPGSRRSRTNRRRIRRFFGWGVSIALLLLLGSAAWVGARALLAKDELEAAVPLAEKVQAQMLAQDVDAAAATSGELAERTSQGAALTSDPVWRAFEIMPGIGGNLKGMRVLAAAADTVAKDAVAPLAEASGSLGIDAFAPRDGTIDLQPIIQLQGPAREAAAAFERADELIADEGVDAASLYAPLSQARDRLMGVLGEARTAVAALDKAARLVPAMLGVDQPREVLLLFQNNAELRSTGGVPGALALLRTDSGSFELIQQASSSDFPRFDPPVVDLPAETRALWGNNTARYIQDVTFAPQFELGASVAREMWARQFGVAPESVFAVDPVALSYLLRATGPVTLPSGDQLSAENAVQLLLTDVYERYPNAVVQDAFFAAAAASVLDALRAGNIDARALVEALVQAGEERRILIWNADPAEQQILEDTTLAGDLPVSNDSTQAFGVYLNDMTMSKMDAYLDVNVSAGSQVCRQDGVPQYDIEVTLTNTAPADAATSLPAYVTGAGESVPRGNIKTSVHVYSSPGTYNLGVTQGGQAAGYHPTSDSGYTLSRVESELAPGQSASWRFSFLAEGAGERKPVIQMTPMIYKSEVSGLALSCD